MDFLFLHFFPNAVATGGATRGGPLCSSSDSELGSGAGPGHKPPWLLAGPEAFRLCGLPTQTAAAVRLWGPDSCLHPKTGDSKHTIRCGRFFWFCLPATKEMRLSCSYLSPRFLLSWWSCPRPKVECLACCLNIAATLGCRQMGAAATRSRMSSRVFSATSTYSPRPVCTDQCSGEISGSSHQLLFAHHKHFVWLVLNFFSNIFFFFSKACPGCTNVCGATGWRVCSQCRVCRVSSVRMSSMTVSQNIATRGPYSPLPVTAGTIRCPAHVQ